MAETTADNHYWKYHSLEKLLGCKCPITSSKDEDLFITVHQICELSFHQLIVDLDRTLCALRNISSQDSGLVHIEEALYFLRRVNYLWKLANISLPLLSDMRGFAEFRDAIGPTSGFQSFQFRRIEIMSGVEIPYWEGGTTNVEGKKHVAETRFEEEFGGDLAKCFEEYRKHNLKHYAKFLADKFQIFSQRVPPIVGSLIETLVEYDKRQLSFHRIHYRIAKKQLNKIGAYIGTGGTSYQEYLLKYEKRVAPLFSKYLQEM